MSDREQLDAFSNDLDVLVTRYIREFELSTAGAIGVLALKQHAMARWAFDENEKDDEE